MGLGRLTEASYRVLSYTFLGYTYSRGRFGPGGLYLGAGRQRAVVMKPNEVVGHAAAFWSRASLILTNEEGP